METVVHRVAIARWKVDPPHGAFEQRVPNDGDLRLGAPERDATRRVPWSVEDAKVELAEFEHLAAIKAGIGRRRADSWRNEGTEIEVGILVELLLGAMAERVHGSKPQAHRGEPCDMIAVAVRQNAE